MERSLLDLDRNITRLLDLLCCVSEQAGGRTRQLMKDGQILQAWTDLPDPDALDDIGTKGLEDTLEWYRQSRLPGPVRDLFMMNALEEAGIDREKTRRWFENALKSWSLSFFDFPFDTFWSAYEDSIRDLPEEGEWLNGCLQTILKIQNHEYGRLRLMPRSAYVLVISVDYDEQTDRYFADVEAGLPLSRTALRQLGFEASEFCETHHLEPMDEDGTVFVLGLKQEEDTLVPELQAAADLSELVDEIIRIVKAE